MEPEIKKKCKLCIFVRYFTLVIFILTVCFAAYVHYEKGKVVDRINEISKVTKMADSPSADVL